MKVFTAKEYYKSGNSILQHIENSVQNLLYVKDHERNTVLHLIKQSQETGSLLHQWKGDAGCSSICTLYVMKEDIDWSGLLTA
jgi:hypothetical protein